jgi:hypothetical protein
LNQLNYGIRPKFSGDVDYALNEINFKNLDAYYKLTCYYGRISEYADIDRL